MFRFQKLEVVHWDFWERFSIPLDAGVITVVGPNGSGKTTLLDALRTLLCIDCSAGRDYKRYVRRNDKPMSWLRAVVDNERQESGLRPFFPFLSDTVTLACQIRKKGGDWQRQYVVAEGDVSIEDLEEKGDWIGVRDFRQRLENAGLSHAIRHVLALEQGDTDKLCEYSPRQLLELVFSVFGDQEVLDNYQLAKNDQQEIGRELEKLEEELARLGARLREAEFNVNSYREWRRLKDEVVRLETEILPKVQLADLGERIRGMQGPLRARRGEMVEKRRRLGRLMDERDGFGRTIQEAKDLEKALDAEKKGAEGAFLEWRDRVRDAEKTLAEKGRLEGLLREQKGGVDVVALAAEQRQKLQERAENDRELKAIETQLRELRARLAAWKSGGRIDPHFVEEFRSALKGTAVPHRMLTEIVEVKDAGWQGALEGILAPYAHLVLLESPGDRQKAWELGEKLRYRHFVVADRSPVPRVEKGSLLEIVRFREHPPLWLADLLNRIRRVETVQEGRALPADQSWITRQGYHRERRGGRHIGVEGKYQFGEGARAAQVAEAERETAELGRREGELKRAGEVLTRRIGELNALLAGEDAVRQLAARADEFSAAEKDFAELQRQAQEAAVAAAEKGSAHSQAVEARHARERALSGLEAELRSLEADLRRQETEFRGHRRQVAENIRDYRGLRSKMHPDWRSRKALASLKEEYPSGGAVRHEMQRVQSALNEGSWVTDEQVVAVQGKLKGDYSHLEETIRARRIHHERHLRATEEARESYINVLKATVRRYSRNVRSLGELAGIGVETEPPHLINEDIALAQAGLNVHFNFDQKGLIGLNDGEASGGQQVMKSLILLIGLLMDENRTGGFVFIDEPFAHLDVFNIDKVGAFLMATKAQYVLTTPNTHNVNVFKTSDLTLVTQKRRHPEKWAQPVAFIRRAVGAVKAA